MKNFRYFYGFLILAILVGGLYFANNTTLANSLNPDKPYVAKGLREPRGKNTLGEMIKAYDLDKEEFYEALHLSIDYPEDIKIITIVRAGEIKYQDIKDYMDPIIEEFKLK